ncbi:MAG TPA: pseudouridine synthase [bacterium]|nr:pseudouridine synthase [bacterium]HOL92771.1 pseudouridine synthase [bacterium]HPO99015.1 pseudouridine synthase [bacterium]
MTRPPNHPFLRNPVRLNKLLARHGLCSRRQADEWIRAGRVSVDGLIQRELGTQVDPTRQTVAVDGRPLKQAPPYLYLALHKPVGVVTTRDDPQGRKTVLDLLPEPWTGQGLFPVGRLDSDSSGLLLLTNDGDWSQILLHPRHQVWKEYWVITDQVLTREQRKRLEQGVMLDHKKTAPARITLVKSGGENSRRFQIAIREGRNRQIRRMCAAVGLHVVSLQRIRIGPITLGELPPGICRPLTQAEVDSIFHLSQGRNPPESCT